MKKGNWLVISCAIIIIVVLSCVIAGGDIPPISVQNGHTSITADFDAGSTSGYAPCTISFTDKSSGIVDYREWSFGDGENSSEINPVHLYTTPGVYTVSLEVTGTGGTDKKTRIGYINVTELGIPTDSTILENAIDIQKESPPPQIIQSDEVISSPVVLNETENPELLSHESVPDQTDISPIKANFSVVKTSGLAPLEISFTDISTGPISMWLWDFGDGTSSAAKSPIHVYQDPGIYSISLLTKGESGSDTIIKKDLIQVIEPVSASFTVPITEGLAPFTVSFNEQCNGTILRREWQFGDGEGSNSTNPVHIYKKPGVYDVSLTVFGSHNEDTKTKATYIVVKQDLPTLTQTVTPSPDQTHIQEPAPKPVNTITETQNPDELVSKPSNAEIPELPPVQVNFEISPLKGDVPLNIHAKDLSSGEISRWNWDFGDGDTSNEQNPEHQYSIPGDYQVNLTVYGPDGKESLSKTESVQVNAIPDAPKADFSITDIEGVVPFSLVCTDMSVGQITDWLWDFGDGKIVRAKNPTHTYYESGLFSISLMVKGPGGKNEVKKHVTVKPPEIPLQASFNISNNEGYVPLKVGFSDTSSGKINGWLWKFGDGKESSEQNPNHEYTKPGQYSVTLTVLGDKEKSEVLKENVIIVKEEAIPIQAAFTALSTSGDSPFNVSFVDKSIGNIQSWNWEFGDGISSNEKNPSHTYTKPGIYSVSLDVKGETGSDSIDKKDLISVSGSTLNPELLINANPLEGVAPLMVTFSKNSINNENSCLWNFGDGKESSESNPSHLYPDPGFYSVSLTIQDIYGNNRTVTKNQFINVTEPVPPPVAEFLMNITEGFAPVTVRFTDMSMGEISQWTWKIEDGFTKNSRDCTYTFTEPGNYSIELDAIGPGGSDKARKEIRILSPPIMEDDIINNTIPAQNESILVIPEKDIKQTPEIFNFTHDTEKKTETVTKEPVNPVQTDKVNSELNISKEVVSPVYLKNSENSFLKNPSLFISETRGYAPLTVKFNSSWSDNSGKLLWDFGDECTSMEMKPNHTYNESGTYSVHLVYETENETKEIIKNNLIEVLDASLSPMASFIAEPNTGVAPLQVFFRSTSEGNIKNWDWEFGDNGKGQGNYTSHVYTKPGVYSITLQISGPDGSSEETINDYIIVTAPPVKPKAEIISDNKTSRIISTVWSTEEGSEPDGKKSVIFYDNVSKNNSISSDLAQLDYNDSTTRRGYVVVSTRPDPLIARFNVSTSSGIAPLQVDCSSTSSGIIKRYLWEFGDGSVSEDKNPSHQYTDRGTYILKLTVYGNGGISSADQIITVGP